MTAQLSREIVENLLQYNDESDSPANAESWEVNALCRMALAGMDVEPVAYMIGGHYLMHAHDPKVDNYASAVPLYAAPPAPVAVPDELTREEYKRRFMEEDNFDDTYRGGWNAFRSAMLKAGHVTAATVPDGWKLVPVEPTEAMLDAAYSHPASTEDRMRKQYASMLAAAPAAPEQEVK